MKYNILLLVLILCGSLLVSTSVFAAEETQDASPSAVIEYTFPYPGLLPDSPLYVFKTVRDRLVSILIKDTLKKASFDLLQADKRVYSSVLLAKKSQVNASLIVSTFSKGDNYFEEAVHNLAKAKREKRDVTLLQGQMQTAAKKYKEVLEDIGPKVTSKKEAYKILLERADVLIQKADDL